MDTIETTKKTKIALIGGHFTTAFAIKSELQDHGFENLIWIGSKYSQTLNKNYSLEYLSLRDDKSIKFIEFEAGKLWRKFTKKTLIIGFYNLLLIPIGFIKAISIILKEKPKLIISFGGYLALPIVVIGKVLGVKVLTHEQTVVSGLTNKIIAYFADRVCISWEESYKFFPKKKTVFTGLPIRRQLLDLGDKKDNFNNNLPTLLVTAGNQGSNTINWRLLKILPQLLEKINIIHITGNSTLTQDYQTALEVKSKLPEKLQLHYIVFDVVKTKPYSNFLNSANIILGRAGANTVVEILHTGKLAILIPIPWSSNNEQLLNAKVVEKTGLGLTVQQNDKLTPNELYRALNKALKCFDNKQGFNGKKIDIVIANAKNLVNSDAAKNIYQEVLKLINN